VILRKRKTTSWREWRREAQHKIEETHCYMIEEILC